MCKKPPSVLRSRTYYKTVSARSSLRRKPNNLLKKCITATIYRRHQNEARSAFVHVQKMCTGNMGEFYLRIDSAPLFLFGIFLLAEMVLGRGYLRMGIHGFRGLSRPSNLMSVKGHLKLCLRRILSLMSRPSQLLNTRMANHKANRRLPRTSSTLESRLRQNQISA